MQPPPGAPLALQAPPARDPVTKLQILLGNLLKHFTWYRIFFSVVTGMLRHYICGVCQDVVVHLSEVAPSRSLLGAVEAAPAPAEGTSSAAGAAPDGTMTQEQLNDFILSCSRGVGSLVQLIEEEANKLPDGYQSQAEVAEELRYLAAENELASSELRRLVAVVRHVREAARESYRAAATEGARITID
ncbi:hypothetical protein ACSSS7_001043 [Eimeria intestinalis]